MTLRRASKKLVGKLSLDTDDPSGMRSRFDNLFKNIYVDLA